MDLEMITLTEVNQTERVLRAAISFYYNCGLCLLPIRRKPPRKKETGHAMSLQHL